MAARFGRRRILGFSIAIVCLLILCVYLFKFGPLAGQAGMAADSLQASDSTKAGGDSTGRTAQDKKKKDFERVPVEVAVVENRGISAYYLTTAALEPEKKVEVMAKIAGEVEALHVEEGTVVQEGVLLCELDDREPKVALEEARINRDKQKREFERLQSIHDNNLVSEKEFSDVKYQYELAQNQYEAALVRYEYTKIQAPFSGVITLRAVDKGGNVSVGTKLFEIADLDPLLLKLYLPENEMTSIKIGQEVIITPDNNPEARLDGRITLISPKVDERTGTVKVTVETRGQAKPGSFVRIRIVTDTHDKTLAIPRRGVVADAGETFVFVAEADTARKVPVGVGYEDEEYAEILTGVALGDTVVVVGAGGLKTGTKLDVLNRAETDSTQVNDVARAGRDHG
jgi:membrane fusion protein (multidrug efflux system)